MGLIGVKRLIYDFFGTRYKYIQLLDGDNHVKTYLYPMKKFAKMTEIRDKKLKLAFFRPEKPIYKKGSGEYHLLDLRDAKELSTEEQKNYTPFHSLMGIKWESEPNVKKKIDTEKQLYFVGVLPSFFENILNTKFTESIIKPPPKKWEWLEPYIPWIIVAALIITVIFAYG